MSARSKTVKSSETATVTEDVAVKNDLKDNSTWVKETHIHDHDGCYDLLHCTGGRDIGQYKRKTFKEGNYLTDPSLGCGAEQ